MKFLRFISWCMLVALALAGILWFVEGTISFGELTETQRAVYLAMCVGLGFVLFLSFPGDDE